MLHQKYVSKIQVQVLYFSGLKSVVWYLNGSLRNLLMVDTGSLNILTLHMYLISYVPYIIIYIIFSYQYNLYRIQYKIWGTSLFCLLKREVELKKFVAKWLVFLLFQVSTFALLSTLVLFGNALVYVMHCDLFC